MNGGSPLDDFELYYEDIREDRWHVLLRTRLERSADRAAHLGRLLLDAGRTTARTAARAVGKIRRFL